jgi:hypothetical protein
VRIALDELFDAHTIQSVSADLFLSGRLDPELLPLLAEMEFDTILTADMSMLREHREIIRSSGLHWIGVSQVKVRGEDGIAFLAASIFAALPLTWAQAA